MADPFSRIKKFISGRGVWMTTLLLLGSVLLPGSTMANERIKVAENYTGNWCGPGKIVAGKYDKTNFNCQLDLTVDRASNRMTMGGSCRVGVFPKPMQATIDLSKRNITGAFFPNSEPDRLDITSGNVQANAAKFRIQRKHIDGEVAIRRKGSQSLNGTVSVRAGLEMVPVIQLSLQKCDR